METAELLRQVRHVFDPLTERLGLGDPSEVRQSNTSFSIAYAGTEVGLQIIVDIGDFFIYALLFKPSVAEFPVGYRDAQGTRQKLYVQEALSELSIDCKAETVTLQRLGGDYRNCDEMASRLAMLVEKHWSALAARGAQWFR